MFKKIVMTILLIIMGFASIIAMNPSDYSVSRNIIINAPASSVFPMINNFKNWEKWSPWKSNDPGAKTTFEGPEQGLGAIMRWSDSQSVGSITITQSVSNEFLDYALEFEKPLKSKATSQFTLSSGENTVVTWSMSGKHNFLGKVFAFFYDTEKMIGESYELGLNNLKSFVENQSKLEENEAAQKRASSPSSENQDEVPSSQPVVVPEPMPEAQVPAPESAR